MITKPLSTKITSEDSVFIKCECQAEGLGVDFEKEERLFYLSFWSQGLSNRKLSLKDRLRYSFRCLFKGVAFNDQLILSIDNAKHLNMFLSGTTRKVSDEIANVIKGNKND
ncbi:MAG: hypothetical protein ACR2ON_01090 [Paracoccaceae bacterium]